MAAREVLVPARSRLWPYAVGGALSIALALPFLLRANAWYEWASAYWFLLVQTKNIHSSGLPSFFIHSQLTGLFYPNQIFYAGFTVTGLAYLAQIVSPWSVFVGSIILYIIKFYMTKSKPKGTKTTKNI